MGIPKGPYKKEELLKLAKNKMKDAVEKTKEAKDKAIETEDAIEELTLPIAHIFMQQQSMKKAVETMHDVSLIDKDSKAALTGMLDDMERQLVAVTHSKDISKKSGLELEKLLDDEVSDLNTEVDNLNAALQEMGLDLDEAETVQTKIERELQEKEAKLERAREKIRKKIGQHQSVVDSMLKAEKVFKPKSNDGPKLKKVAENMLTHLRSSRAKQMDIIAEFEKELAAL